MVLKLLKNEFSKGLYETATGFSSCKGAGRLAQTSIEYNWHGGKPVRDRMLLFCFMLSHNRCQTRSSSCLLITRAFNMPLYSSWSIVRIRCYCGSHCRKGKSTLLCNLISAKKSIQRAVSELFLTFFTSPHLKLCQIHTMHE